MSTRAFLKALIFSLSGQRERSRSGSGAAAASMARSLDSEDFYRQQRHEEDVPMYFAEVRKRGSPRKTHQG